MRLAKLGLLFIAIVTFSASAGDVRADLQIKIYEDGNTATAQTYTTTGTQLVVDTSSTSIGSAAPDYTISGLTAKATNGSPQGNINLTGTVVSKNAALHTLTILVTENTFVASGTSYSMASSSSYSLNTSSVDPKATFAFKSYATPGSVLFGTAIGSPGHTYGGSVSGGLGFGSDNFTEAATPFISSTGYSLTENFAFTSSLADDNFSPTGSTLVTPTAVPEPASILMLVFGAGSAGLVAARRRSRRRSGCPDSRTGNHRID